MQKNKKLSVIISMLSLLVLFLTSCGMSRYNNNIYKTSTDGPPKSGFNPKLVKHLKLKQETQSEYGNSPYLIDNKVYIPKQSAKGYNKIGIASWYGTQFHSKLTSNKEKYDMYALTAAHKTLPLPSYVKVTNLENNKNIIVRVNDRGPFVNNRIIDLSYAAANKLGFAKKGTAKVRVTAISPYSYPENNSNKYNTKYTNKKHKITFLSIQFAAFHKYKNALQYSSQIKKVFLKYKVHFTPKISKSDNIYLIEGRVKTIKQYNKVKYILEKNKLTPPFITKIHTKH